MNRIMNRKMNRMVNRKKKVKRHQCAPFGFDDVEIQSNSVI